MAIAISGIISVTVIIVAMVMSAGYIVARQEKKMPRRIVTQEEQEEIERYLERYECCTRVINWIPIEEKKPGADHVLVTLQHSADDFEVCEMDWGTWDVEWRNKVIAWAKMPEPYKKPSKTA